jgi:indolepyruvate ferredoxin oxidoreductase alpha subunit
MKEILSGNEAIARGFYEAGGRLAAAYPGTPSTEVLGALTHYADVHAEWSTNEKAAFETAMGGSISGVRSMACMKHVGVNVAADPLVSASYTGVNAGLILMAADDPGMFSSQNEQDSRHYAMLAKIPCLEPSDSQEAADFAIAALRLSEEFDTPVMLRTTTRISHSKSTVEISGRGSRKGRGRATGLVKDMAKYVMMPATARVRHAFVEERLERLKAWAEESSINRVDEGDGRIGIITSGISYQYAREAFPAASVLKLGMTWPLPETLIKNFARKVKKLAVVEELDPIIEHAVKAMGVKVHYGKNVLPVCGEFSSRAVSECITGKKPALKEPVKGLPGRPPTLCPGCSHRGLFIVLDKLKAYVSGDIGCYTLGALPPFNALHTTLCMGASITAAHGISRGLSLKGVRKKPVAVIGDSTFLHSGITGLVNMVYNGGDAITVIMNNDTTGMTGGQEHPGTGRDARGRKAPKIGIDDICRAVGVRVREVDTYDLRGLEKAIKQEMSAKGPSVLISNQPCVLRQRPSKKPMVAINERCNGCGLCLKAGCIALALDEGDGARSVEIDPLLCTGCGLCAQLCRAAAIEGVL